MGNRVVVKPHSELVSIRSTRKGGKPHFMGSCILEDVTVGVAGIEGDLLYEFTETREPGVNVLKHLSTLVHTDRGFVPGEAWEAYVTALDEWIESGDSDTTEPDFPSTVTGESYRAAYVCGSEFYVG